MDKQSLISKIHSDFKEIPLDIFGIFLYGSYAGKKEDERSDIDICLVAGEYQDPKDLQFIAWRNIKSGIYDIRIFELLPLYIQMSILIRGILVKSSDEYALYEYLYQYWKKWDDQKYYQTPIPGIS